MTLVRWSFLTFALTASPLSLALVPPSSKTTNQVNPHLNPIINRRDALSTCVVGGGGGGLLLPSITSPASATTPTPPSSNQPTLDTKSGIAYLPPNNTPFPLASFGLQIYDDNTAYKLTTTALEVGYRNFFASVLAGNQKGFARAIRDSGIPRSQLYICGSVISNRVRSYDDAFRMTQNGYLKNMDAFGVGDITYLDQIMLDYPASNCEAIKGQWSAFQEMKEGGLTKSLSVSNFNPTQLDCILNDPQTTSRPVVNQLPYSVAYHPKGVIEENQNRGVLVQAWSPLGYSLGGRFSSSMKSTCLEIGKKYDKSLYQVALRWIIQNGVAFTTQSKKKEHFEEDIQVFDFELSMEDMSVLDSLALL